MGARIYVASMGRFLQVDSVQGGTDNAYVYVTDPVNDFDLSGEFGWKGVANLASWASVIPGPIGMAAAGVSVVAYAAAGDKKAALIACAGIAAAAVGAGVVVKAAQAAKSAGMATRIASATRVSTKLKPLGEGGYISIGRGGKSVNQINQDIKRGVAPKTLIRADVGKVKGEQNHIHLTGRNALNINGSWKHGGRALTNVEKRYIKKAGWRLPR